MTIMVKITIQPGLDNIKIADIVVHCIQNTDKKKF